MKKLLTSLVIVALSSTPVAAQTMKRDKAEALVEVCRKDLTQYFKGDKNWLERKLVTAPPALRGEVITVCKFYAQGVLDALATVAAERRKNIT